MELKMNIPTFFIYMILVTLISRVKTSDANDSAKCPPGPLGTFSCNYFGEVQQTCNGKPTSVGDLPDQCTSFVYDGLIIARIQTANDNSTNSSSKPKPISDQYPSLDSLKGNGKPVFLNVYHGGNMDGVWRYDGKDVEDQACADADFLKAFIAKHGDLKGIILSDVDLTMYRTDIKKFQPAFIQYVTTLKQKLDILVGVNIPADVLIFLDSKCVGSSSVYDFVAMDCSIDFYVFNFDTFNKCKPNLVKGGVTPLDGTEQNTLTNLEFALNRTKIPQEKTYFKYQVFATSQNVVEFRTKCYNSWDKMCEYPDLTKNWCADTSATFREKGQFANQYGAGFIVDSIDLDDAKEKCHCSSAYPAFNYLMDGWNNENKYPDCCLFDRISVK